MKPRLGDARVDKYATVMVDKNRYSVPWKYAGRRLKTIVHVDRVETAVELALEKNLSGSERVRRLLIYSNEQIIPIAQLPTGRVCLLPI